MNRNPKVDAYLRELNQWQDEITALRELVLVSELDEDFKWSKPCYTWNNHNIVILQNFKNHCAILFPDGSLLDDPNQLLQKPGENTNTARRILFKDLQSIVSNQSAIKKLIKQAIQVAETSASPSKTTMQSQPAFPDYPTELVEKFRNNPEFETAFHRLTPGRQRGYLIHFNDAKQSATRTARIEKYTAKILAGKGIHDFDHSASKTQTSNPSKKKTSTGKARLLSGGNPQIAKGEGDAPVQSYISALSGWKKALVQQIDELIVRLVPDVRKAVKWNSPFYGIEGRGWFISFHVFTKYVKVTFFNGISLNPPPPGHTPKSGQARWIDLHEKDSINEAEFASWIKQASSLPGWDPSQKNQPVNL